MSLKLTNKQHENLVSSVKHSIKDVTDKLKNYKMSHTEHCIDALATLRRTKERYQEILNQLEG